MTVRRCLPMPPLSLSLPLAVRGDAGTAAPQAILPGR